VVFFGRFISVLRTCAAFLAGANRMRWRRFLVANAAGAIAWAGACTLAAYLASGTLQSLSGTIDLITGGTAVLIIAAALLILRRQASRLALRAEAAYPGPLS
jgi:membrane protein DedA with SNARE-associated domain